jgi:hypothetical protein
MKSTGLHRQSDSQNAKHNSTDVCRLLVNKQTGVNVAYLISRSGSCLSRRRLEVGESPSTDAISGCEITLCPNRELKQYPPLELS